MESYMFEFRVNKDMKKMDMIREVAVGKVAAQLCLTLIVKELKICIEHGWGGDNNVYKQTLTITFSVVREG